MATVVHGSCCMLLCVIIVFLLKSMHALILSCCLCVQVMACRWWNAAGHAFLFVNLLETTRMVLLLASVAVGIALTLWRTPASSFRVTPRAAEASRCYLYLSRRTTIVSAHACMLISLVLLSACPVSIAGSIAVGGHHTCALLSSSSVRCWGLNNYGQASAAHVVCCFK
jgi:hypothetical protein